MSSRWRPPQHAKTYPRHRGDWTIAYGDGTYASFSPESGTTIATDPRADRKLPALAAALDRGRLISYRVGRRAVVATESTYLKVVRPSRHDAVLAAHRLVDASDSVSAPTIIHSALAGSIELTAMPGQSLHALGREGPLGTDVIVALAQSLASLHDVAEPEPLPHRSPDPPQRWIDTVARVDRPVARKLTPIAARLPTLGTGTGSVIHGDLHDKNIYVGANGVGFIDLDGLSRGSAECDLANLVVHLKLRALQMEQSTDHASALGALLYNEYAVKLPLDRELACAFEKHTWFRLACLYLLRTTDCRLAHRIVDQLSVA